MRYLYKKAYFRVLIRNYLYTHRPQPERSNSRQSALPEEG